MAYFAWIASRSIASCVDEESAAGLKPEPGSQLDFRHRPCCPSTRTDPTIVWACSTITMRMRQGHVGVAGAGWRRVRRRRRPRAEAKPRRRYRSSIADTSACEAGAVERLAGAPRAARLERQRREELVALQRHRGQAVARAALDREGDDQLAVVLHALMRDPGVAVALRAQIVADPVARVLEQILVGRSFARDGHQLVAHVAGQRIAGEHDADARALHRVERQVDDAILVGEARQGGEPRLVDSRARGDRSGSARSRRQHLGLVRRAGRDAQPSRSSRSGTPGAPITSTAPIVVRAPGSTPRTSVARSGECSSSRRGVTRACR